MGAFFTALLAKIVGFAKWVADCVLQVFVDAWELITDVPVWVFDQVCGLVVSIIAELDLSGFDAYQSTWSTLPAEIANTAAYLGIVEAGGIILAAIMIRLVLQLIPFTRLGS